MNEIKTLGYIFLALALVPFLLMYMKAEGMSEEDSDKVLELINKSTLTEKEAIVADVKHEELKGPKYTIRIGLGGSRKPIPTIKGLTTEERAKEWLETAGLGYTLSTWKRLGEKYKIDYTLAIAIAWSDSHLGKALKSTNNIGNVGNRDDGSVVHYESMDKGIEAIFRALNNRYMKGNSRLGELSGEGRERLGLTPCSNAPAPTKCYASSKICWSTNVSNALSVIHNKQIDEHYNFRLK